MTTDTTMTIEIHKCDRGFFLARSGTGQNAGLYDDAGPQGAGMGRLVNVYLRDLERKAKTFKTKAAARRWLAEAGYDGQIEDSAR